MSKSLDSFVDKATLRVNDYKAETEARSLPYSLVVQWFDQVLSRSCVTYPDSITWCLSSCILKATRKDGACVVQSIGEEGNTTWHGCVRLENGDTEDTLWEKIGEMVLTMDRWDLELILRGAKR